jgi:hypothetical protein
LPSIEALFFALSIALPPIMLPLIAYIGGGRNLNPGAGEGIFFVLMMYGAGPVLQALTILCVYNAVMPPVFKTPPPLAPQKHPLDD